MRRIFFLDYENVDTEGMKGITELNKNDSVYIYYSEKRSRMTFGLHRQIEESSACFYYREIKDEAYYFYYHKIKDGGRNALDQVLMDEADNIVDEDTKARYFIISKDRRYDKFISQCKRDRIGMDQCSSIAEANEILSVELRRKIESRLLTEKKEGRHYDLDETKIRELISILMDSETKAEMNRRLQKIFYNEDVKYIFTQIRDITYNF